VPDLEPAGLARGPTGLRTRATLAFAGGFNEVCTAAASPRTRRPSERAEARAVLAFSAEAGGRPSQQTGALDLRLPTAWPIVVLFPHRSDGDGLRPHCRCSRKPLCSSRPLDLARRSMVCRAVEAHLLPEAPGGADYFGAHGSPQALGNRAGGPDLGHTGV